MSGNNYTSHSAPNYTSSLVVLTSLFFMWGLITSLNDILIPHLQGIFELNNFEAMLVQFCFFAAYFVMSYPSGFLVEKFGYKHGIIIGLATTGIGCLLFYPAASVKSYPLFLFAFFVLASGITLLQVAANPYVTILGSPDTASRRLNLTQAFNSLGTTIGPYLGAMLILTTAVQGLDAAAEARNVQGPYLGLAAVLFLLALAIGMVKLPQVDAPEPDQSINAMQTHQSVWGYRHLVLGAIGIFVYVGAEVSIGSFLVNLFHQPDIANLTKEDAGKYVSLYWGGAMVGRFLGVLIMKYVKPGYLLGGCAIVNVVLLAVAMATAGHTAMYVLLMMGLFNSIMFPTIFSLALEGLGHFTSKGSGILCMAIVGGAILPLLQGALADHIGILHAFIIPLVCYVYIAFYGFKGHNPV